MMNVKFNRKMSSLPISIIQDRICKLWEKVENEKRS